jgi:hypothetical protein
MGRSILSAMVEVSSSEITDDVPQEEKKRITAIAVARPARKELMVDFISVSVMRMDIKKGNLSSKFPF